VSINFHPYLGFSFDTLITTILCPVHHMCFVFGIFLNVAVGSVSYNNLFPTLDIAASMAFLVRLDSVLVMCV
jgi:hypothetical protein